MTEALTTAFSSAVGSIQTDTISMLEKALPAGLAIFGISFVLRKGVSFFRSIAG